MAALVSGLLLAVPVAAAKEDCAAPQPVCAVRASVFAISSPFDPYASAVRIGPDLLVTNRHVVADEREVTVNLPDGRRIPGKVVPASYQGDLILVRAALPEGPAATPGEDMGGDLYAVGHSISERGIRVFPKGHLLRPPEASKPFARLHHTAYTQPGVSGGALVNAAGRFIAIVTSGGAGRFEAIPVARIAELEALSGETHAGRSAEIGKAYRECTLLIEKSQRARDVLPANIAEDMRRSCAASENRQLFDLAAQALGRSRMFDDSIRFFERAIDKDPNAINSRIGLVVTLMFARRHEPAVPHVRWLLDVVPESPEVQRFAVHVGKFTGDKELAGKGLELIAKHNPAQLEPAKRFLEAPLPGQLRRR